MKIFLSWSGALSYELALVLRDWLPRVIQGLKPFFTPMDIAGGARWSSRLAAELEACSFGLIILTSDNLTSRWLHFEAGALSMPAHMSRVCPILFGVELDDRGPLKGFQPIQFNERGMTRLMKQLNSGLGEGRLEDAILLDALEQRWPKLNTSVNELLSGHAATAALRYAGRTDRELLEESVTLLKQFVSASSNTGLVRADGSGAAAVAHALSSLLSLFKSAAAGNPDIAPLVHSVYSSLKFLFSGMEFPSAFDAQIRSLFTELEALVNPCSESPSVQGGAPILIIADAGGQHIKE